MDQLCYQAAKTHYMSGGKLKAQLDLRAGLDATRRSAAQHFQSLYALVAHVAGLNVGLPSSAYEAEGLLKTATRDDGSVVVFEDKPDVSGKGPGAGGGASASLRRGGGRAKQAGTSLSSIFAARGFLAITLPGGGAALCIAR